MQGTAAGRAPARPSRGSRRRGWTDCTALALALWLGAPATTPAQPAPRHGATPVLVVGDSLSAEYGLPRGSGWVALLQARLEERHIAAVAINASISGDTTSGGRSRLPALLAQDHPGIVILELGGNDALRGLPLDMTRDNLQAMATAARAAGARVIIVGMRVPPNYGRQYGEQFAGLFAAVADATHSALVPFLLKGVADVPEADTLFQADRIHPIARAHPTLLNNVWTVLAPMLAR